MQIVNSGKFFRKRKIIIKRKTLRKLLRAKLSEQMKQITRRDSCCQIVARKQTMLLFATVCK